MSAVAIALGLAKLTGLDKKIGGLLGGKNGEAVASKVISMAQQVTGTDDIESISIGARSKEAIQLKEMILRNEEELVKLANEDRADARQMQVAALHQKDLFSKRFIYILASFWSVVAVAYLFGITFLEVPQKSVRFADTSLGFLMGTVINGILGFFFGTSATENERNQSQ